MTDFKSVASTDFATSAQTPSKPMDEGIGDDRKPAAGAAAPKPPPETREEAMLRRMMGGGGRTSGPTTTSSAAALPQAPKPGDKKPKWFKG